MGLRMTSGLNIKRVLEETGLEIEEAYSPQALSFLEKEGLLTRSSTHLIPTFEGRLRLNGLIKFMLGSSSQASTSL